MTLIDTLRNKICNVFVIINLMSLIKQPHVARTLIVLLVLIYYQLMFKVLKVYVLGTRLPDFI